MKGTIKALLVLFLSDLIYDYLFKMIAAIMYLGIIVHRKVK